jgi:hypothetical protein
VRAGRVVVLGPHSEHCSDLIQGEEHGRVQQLIPNLSVEVLVTTVLQWLLWHDVMPLDPLILSLCEDGMRGEAFP